MMIGQCMSYRRQTMTLVFYHITMKSVYLVTEEILKYNQGS